MTTSVTTLDFETEGIEPWPAYPPKPVGLAIRSTQGELKYLAWGHPSENNSTYEEAKRTLAAVWDTPLLFHNSSFDIEVAMKWFGLPYPSNPLNVHDTLFQLFLYDPHADNLSLKPSAARILHMPPEEQDELEKYVRSHIRNIKGWGAYIAQAPAGLVGRYAIGDVDRTFKLHEYLHPILLREGMEAAYRREVKLQPIVMHGTRRGIRVDCERLAQDVKVYEDAMLRADAWLRERLGAPNVNVDSNDELADALDRAGLASDWPTTPTGRRSTSKESLKAAVKAKDVLAMLAYRNTLATCLSTFARPWLAMSSSDGRLHPSWNQVRGADYGTRTGRLSSNGPNFQNVPNEFDVVPPDGFPALPQLRQYLLPEPGHVWLKRDYSQQELRVLAHFEDGQLCHQYQQNPELDVHEYAAELILKYTGHQFQRKQTKIVSFTLVYGGGIPALSAKLDSTSQEASFLKEVYLSSMPDVRKLMDDVKKRGRSRQPVRTTGGRLLYAEPTKDGRDQSYKLLNHLIQGSSADMTKEAIVRWDALRGPHDEFLATVHDEINISAPAECWQESMAKLAEAMHGIELDVPLLSEGFTGPNWADIEDCK